MKTSTQNAIIGGVCVIAAALITATCQKSEATINVFKTENVELIEQNNDLQEKYNDLQAEYKNLERQNNDCKEKLEQYSSIEEENNQLKRQLFELQNSNEVFQKDEENKTQGDSDSSLGKTISIFTLDTFQGEGRWEIPTIETYYTDTYGNVYLPSYIGSHFSNEKDNLYCVPTYLLDNKYSICEGKIAWPKSNKNSSGSCWIDFYSGDVLVYSTEPITATDKPKEFSFSVEGLETLTIVRNSTRSTMQDYVYIIYDYLNLIEK